jgi:hypothetical protein
MAEREDGAEQIASYVAHTSVISQAGFTMIPNAVMLRGDLRPGAKLVYGYLKHLAWKERKESVAALQEIIAADLHLSVNTVTSLLRELQAAPAREGEQGGDALVEAIRRGQGYPNLYRVNDPDVPESPTSRSPNLGIQESQNSGFYARARQVGSSKAKTQEQDKNAPQTVQNRRVTEDERTDAKTLLATFNYLTGSRYAGKEWVAKIVMRLRENPNLIFAEHLRVLAYSVDHPWWRGHPSPAVIYGNAALYERTVEQERAPADGRGMTADEIRNMD